MFDKKKKGEGEEMHPAMKKAKMGVLKHLSDMASEAMGGKLHGLKKVTVASDSEEGLKEGMDKAKEIVEKGKIPGDSHEIADMSDSEEHEASESPAEEELEQETGEEDLSPEEIEKKIAELKALLASKKA